MASTTTLTVSTSHHSRHRTFKCRRKRNVDFNRFQPNQSDSVRSCTKFTPHPNHLHHQQCNKFICKSSSSSKNRTFFSQISPNRATTLSWWLLMLLLLPVISALSSNRHQDSASLTYDTFVPDQDDGQLQLRFTVSEGVPAGTFIGLIKSSNQSILVEPPFLIVPVPGQSSDSSGSSSLTSSSSSSERDNLAILSLSSSSSSSSFGSSSTDSSGTVDTDLNIDQSTGEIRTAIQLDREQRSHYSFIAISLTGVNIYVNIIIEDINDNAPKFPATEIELEFPENSKPREVKRTLPPARDRDRGQYGTQSYRIVSGNIADAFRLVSHREKDDILYLDLQVNGVLDRETTASYRLVIEALDGGQPPLSDQIIAKISILDHNDCEPIFSQSHYYGTVAENVTLGTSLLKVTATDNDQAENGQIYYSLLSKNSGNSGNSAISTYFGIDRQTGWIFVAKPLDFEQQDQHELIVIARDQGSQPLETSALVSIRVTDVNDNKPTVNLLFLTANSKPEIWEDAKIGDLIARVSVNDGSQQHQEGPQLHGPSSSNGKINDLQLVGCDRGEFGLTTQDRVTYLIVVTGKLDRETKSRYQLSVMVVGDQSSGTSGQSSNLTTTTSATFDLDVLDINDNAPYFETGQFFTTLPEAADIGSSVFQMNAVDRDSDSILTYAFLLPRTGYNQRLLSSGDHHQNDLDLDDEDDDDDLGLESFKQQQKLNLNSDRASNTNRGSGNSGNSGNGGYLHQFNQRNKTHFLSTKTSWFSIDQRSGLIVTRTQVDCETDSQPSLTVFVTDSNDLATGNHTEFITTATLLVSISDINDNEPIFDQSFYNVTVSEDQPLGACIVQIAATDPDCGVNALVNYTFASNLPYFTSASSSTSSFYGFGGPDSGPSPLATILHSHSGGGSSSLHHQLIQANNQHDFELDPKTGQLCIGKQLDFERTSVYDLAVLATDRGGLSTTAMIKIQVIDTNDNYPIFYPHEYKVSVQENVVYRERIPLVIVAATDRDSSNTRYGQITYSILNGNERKYFEIDSRSGEIFLLKPLHKSTEQEDYDYRLTITAHDGGNLEAERPATVLISILTADSRSMVGLPVFVQRQFNFEIIENVAQGAMVGTVRAELKAELDQGQYRAEQSSPISYTIYSGDPEGYFSIDPRHGSISVKSPNIDRESHGSLMLNVQAYAGQYPGPYRYAHAQVNVTILDENDNVPQFPSQSLKISIPENVYHPGPKSLESGDGGEVVVVFVAYAVDADAGQFGTIRYSLYSTDVGDNPQKNYRYSEANGDELQLEFDERQQKNSGFPFMIEERTGKVRLVRALDYERRSDYRIRVVAVDGGQLSSEMIVDVLVQDVNDNVPVFVGTSDTIELQDQEDRNSARKKTTRLPLYSVSVPENIGVNSHFYQLKATDSDTGNNARLTYSLQLWDNSKNRSPKDSVTLPIDIFPNNGILYVKDALDRELLDQYRLLITVADHGSPQSLNTTAILDIVVTDINDNRPYWHQQQYQFEIGEDAPIGTSIGTLSAFDVDLQGNSTLRYNISSTQGSSTDNQYFRINHETGQLFLRATLDRELKDRYELLVEVCDQGIPQPLCGDERATVLITVLDVNDNRPVFDQNGVIDKEDHDQEAEEEEEVVSVPLGTQRKSSVASFKARDPDLAENGTVTYSMIDEQLNPEEEQLFTIDRNTGMLITKVDIRDQHRSSSSSGRVHRISLQATDGRGKKSKIKVVKIEIVDKRTLNLNLDNVDTVEFKLNRPASAYGYGDRLGSLELPSQIVNRFQCSGRFFSHFNVQLKEEVPFFVDSDLESNKLNILALKRLNRTTIVDHQENRSPLKSYRLLACIDWSQCSVSLMNTGDLSTISTSTSSSSPQCDHYVKLNVDFSSDMSEESFCKRPILLRSTTAATSSIISESSETSISEIFEVKIPWNFDNGKLLKQKHRINELLYLNQTIDEKSLQLCAENQLKLSSPVLDSGTLARLFYISDDRTVLMFRSQEKELIQRYLRQDFLLSIEVRSSKIPDRLIQSVPVRVKVLSSNHQIGNIAFVNERFLELDEDCCRIGSGILQARINVSHDDFKIRYFLANYAEHHHHHHNHRQRDQAKTISTVSSGGHHLVSSDEQFTLNPDSGLLYLKRELDYERKHEHRLNITAVVYDSKAPIVSVSHIVKIRIRNINDESPIFVRKVYEKSVPENAQTGLLLLQLEAKDSDQPVQPNITYQMPGSYPQAEYFNLNYRNGELKLMKELDREKIQTFRIPVYAFDEDFRHSTLTIVHIKVTDINDNAPYFVYPKYDLKIPETVQPGTVILNLIALDPDLSNLEEEEEEEEVSNTPFLDQQNRDDRNFSNFSSSSSSSGMLQYRILSGNFANKFSLDARRAKLRIDGPLDREIQPAYSLLIEVSDSMFVAQCQVTIKLEDVNDNAPIFDKFDYYSMLCLDEQDNDGDQEHDRDVGWLPVVTVRAIDSDGDKLLYSIFDDNDQQQQQQRQQNGQINPNSSISNLTRYFNINSETGEITIHSLLLRPIFEKIFPKNVLTFEVGALEAGNASYRSHQSRAKVHLTLVSGSCSQSKPQSSRAQALVSSKISQHPTRLAGYPTVIVVDRPRESLRSGQTIGTIEFQARQSQGSNSYRIVNGGENFRSFNDYFSIEPDTGSIVVRRPLTQNYYEAIVEIVPSTSTAISTPTTTTTLLQIMIGGIDDRKFVHTIRLNNVTIIENQIAENLLKLADYLPQSSVGSYEFILAYSQIEFDYFDLNRRTGQLKLRNSLDYETQPNQIELIVLAIVRTEDRPLFQDAFQYSITVNVENVDDNRPQFTQRHYIAALAEGDPTGSMVAQVNAIDIDELINLSEKKKKNTKDLDILERIGRFSYYIVDGNEDNAFSIGVNDGLVRTNIVLDREIRDRYYLKIVASDMSQGSSSSASSSDSMGLMMMSDSSATMLDQHMTQCLLEVIVIDQNDNVPVFPPKQEVSVSEDAPIGSVIATISANDVDIFPMLSYSKPLTTGNRNFDHYFDIGLYSGKIFLKASLKSLMISGDFDSERLVRKIRLPISASDHQHSIETEITINIKRNQSNLAPKFDGNGNYYRRIEIADDDDDGSEGGGSPSILTDINVEVFRVPMLTVDGSGDQTQGPIVYGLNSADSTGTSGMFYIDPHRGIIYNNRTLGPRRGPGGSGVSGALSGSNLAVPRRFISNLEIVARYQNSLQTSRASLVIVVEHRPSTGGQGSSTSHHPNNYHLEIESSQIGEPLLRLPKPHPADSYQIVSGNTNKNFHILRGNELVLDSRPLTDQYSLIVKPVLASSSQSTSNHQNRTILIHLKVRPDSFGSSNSQNSGLLHPSPFKSKIFELEISETEPVGTEIQSLKIGSLDKQNYRFKIVSGNDGDSFQVDERLGILKIQKSLDYETISSYRIAVLAESSAAVYHFAILNIQLINVNEFCPQFFSTHLKAIIEENSPIGSLVAPIRAVDLDRNSRLNYTVIRLNSDGGQQQQQQAGAGTFRYDSNLGYLVVNGPVDYEQNLGSNSKQTGPPVHKFIVRASDLGQGSMKCNSVETILEVQIGSVDEFNPKFSSESYEFKVATALKQSRRSRVRIGQVSATDQDQGPDGLVRYSIKSVSPLALFDTISINQTTGWISMNIKANSQQQQQLPKQFSLIVSSSSGRINSLSSLAIVDVKLSIVNGISSISTDEEDIEELNDGDDGDGFSSIGSSSTTIDTVVNKEASLPGWIIFLTVLLLLITVVLLSSIFVIRLHQNQQQQSFISGHLRTLTGGGGNGTGVGSLLRKVGPISGSAVMGDSNHHHHGTLHSNLTSPAYSVAHYGTTVPGTGSALLPPCYNDVTASSNSALINPLHSEGLSASSGRGSADDDADLDDVDEEIRMINEASYYQDDEDCPQEVTTTAEYLARLGVSNHYEQDSSSIAIEDDDLDQYNESGDVLSEMGGRSSNSRYGTKKGHHHHQRSSTYRGMGGGAGNSRSASAGIGTQAIVAPSSGDWPPMCGSLNSIVHNEEELSGSYNWDYLQHWGPKYQPLSSVFAEIARLKSVAQTPSNTTGPNSSNNSEVNGPSHGPSNGSNSNANNNINSSEMIENLSIRSGSSNNTSGRHSQSVSYRLQSQQPQPQSQPQQQHQPIYNPQQLGSLYAQYQQQQQQQPSSNNSQQSNYSIYGIAQPPAPALAFQPPHLQQQSLQQQLPYQPPPPAPLLQGPSHHLHYQGQQFGNQNNANVNQQPTYNTLNGSSTTSSIYR